MDIQSISAAVYHALQPVGQVLEGLGKVAGAITAVVGAVKLARESPLFKKT